MTGIVSYLKILLCCILLKYATLGFSQSLAVSSFKQVLSAEASTHKRMDNNGKACALIKVRCVATNLTFKEAIGNVENKAGEYWVFVPERTRTLTISGSDINSQLFSFSSINEISEVSSLTTYVMTLTLKNENESHRNNTVTLDSSIDDYKNLAEAGDPVAQCKLGRCYYYGLDTRQNFIAAKGWFLKSAIQGNAEAQYYLGRCYYYGQGFPKPNYEQAAKWYEKAAIQNNAEAQYELAKCYEEGKGVKKNAKEANNWYEKATLNKKAKDK